MFRRLRLVRGDTELSVYDAAMQVLMRREGREEGVADFIEVGEEGEEELEVGDIETQLLQDMLGMERKTGAVGAPHWGVDRVSGDF